MSSLTSSRERNSACSRQKRFTEKRLSQEKAARKHFQKGRTAAEHRFRGDLSRLIHTVAHLPRREERIDASVVLNLGLGAVLPVAGGL